MARAIVLGVLRRSDEALKVLARIESRWPEWDLTYLVNGVILDSQLKAAEAKQMFDIAIALGTQEAEAYYYRAQIATETPPVNLEEAQTSISQALALNPKDANIRLLAGKILLERKEYDAAVEQLLSAVRLQPTLVRAHNLLRTAYRELGQSDKAAEELKQVEQITEGISDPDPVSSSMERLLFDVRPPDGAPSSE